MTVPGGTILHAQRLLESKGAALGTSQPCGECCRPPVWCSLSGRTAARRARQAQRSLSAAAVSRENDLIT